MSFKKEIFFCLNCDNSAFSREKVIHDDCQSPFLIAAATVTFHLPRKGWWGNFVHWFFSKDIGLVLSFVGMIGVNVVITQHLHFSLAEAVIEGLCFGFMMPRFLK